jgi:hypothetical protein
LIRRRLKLFEIGTAVRATAMNAGTFSTVCSHLINLFITFVDAVFTSSLQPLFTKASNVHARTSARACVWCACIAD